MMQLLVLDNLTKRIKGKDVRFKIRKNAVKHSFIALDVKKTIYDEHP